MSSFPLYLMRHGESVLQGRMVGHLDCEVTHAGIAACARQGRDLDTVRLVSSDLRRARRCAEVIGRPHLDARWRELDFGQWDGLMASEIDADALSRFWDDPDAHAPPEGERWSQLLSRVGAAIDELSAEPTLVVTHAGAIRAALCRLCGFSLAQGWAFDLPCSAVLCLNVWDGPKRQAQVAGLWP